VCEETFLYSFYLNDVALLSKRLTKEEATRRNVAQAEQGMSGRWKIMPEELQFCMDCGGEWTEENPCTCYILL
jgi:hypothetical protein